MKPSKNKYIVISIILYLIGQINLGWNKVCHNFKNYEYMVYERYFNIIKKSQSCTKMAAKLINIFSTMLVHTTQKKTFYIFHFWFCFVFIKPLWKLQYISNKCVVRHLGSHIWLLRSGVAKFLQLYLPCSCLKMTRTLQ